MLASLTYDRWVETKQNKRCQSGGETEWRVIDETQADIDDANDALSPADPDPSLADRRQDEWEVPVLSELQVQICK